MIKDIIFDVDGTLVDSVDSHAKAWKVAFSEFGHDIAFEKLRGQIGKGGDQLMPLFLSEEGRDKRLTSGGATCEEDLPGRHLGFPGCPPPV